MQAAAGGASVYGIPGVVDAVERDDAGLQPDRRTLPFTRGWLLLAVAALGLSGIYTVLVVASRVPYLGEVFPWADSFQVAVVVHVVLSIVVWLFAFGAVIWCLTTRPVALPVAWSALTLAVLGTVVMSVTPFVDPAPPVMSDYVPVLDSPLFLTGLALFGLGLAVLVGWALSAPKPVGPAPYGRPAVLRFGAHTALVAGALTLVAFVWSFSQLTPSAMEGQPYYQTLFWGSGHIAQFAFTQLLLVAWLWLAWASGLRLPMTPRVAMGFLLLGIVPTFLTPWVYLAFDVTDVGHTLSMTWMMIFGGGIAALPIGLAVALALGRGKTEKTETPLGDGHVLRSGLVLSVALFGLGGVLGFLISGSNLLIPAHYHGSITGVSLAFMALSYHLLPSFGFAVPPLRLAAWQVYIYGIGQLIHVTGLAWSGGHNVQRKTAGADQGLEALAEILGMIVMGVGGAIAIVGGALYIIVVAKSVLPSLRGTVTERSVGNH